MTVIGELIVQVACVNGPIQYFVPDKYVHYALVITILTGQKYANFFVDRRKKQHYMSLSTAAGKFYTCTFTN